MATFTVRFIWSDGNLRERMLSEGLPETLIPMQEYTASDELTQAIYNSGAQLVTDWTPQASTTQPSASHTNNFIRRNLNRPANRPS